MDSAPRPLRADAERNRRRILDAARRVFAQSGAEVGVDEVARAAGVGVGTVYRRFPTKEDLVLAVLHDGFERLLARLDAADAPDPWEAFAATMTALAEHVGCDRSLIAIMQEDPALLDAIAGDRRRVLDRLAPVLIHAQEAGAVRADLVVEDLFPLAAIAARLPAWRLQQQPGLWRRYLAVILDGVRADASTPLDHAPPARPQGEAEPPRVGRGALARHRTR